MSALVGHSQAKITITNDTPYGSSVIPVDINVATEFNVSVEPTADGTTDIAGATAVYTLNKTIIGNAADVYNISMSVNQWDVSHPAQVGPLSAGADTNFDIAVTIPTGTSAGEMDVVTIKITSDAIPELSQRQH